MSVWAVHTECVWGFLYLCKVLKCLKRHVGVRQLAVTTTLSLVPVLVILHFQHHGEHHRQRVHHKAVVAHLAGQRGRLLCKGDCPLQTQLPVSTPR